MAISLDVIVGTLIFVLPGFVAVGTYTWIGRFFSRPDLSRSTFALIALTLSLPLILSFNHLASILSANYLRSVGIPELKAGPINPDFLISLSFLYGHAAFLGALAAWIYNGFREIVRRRDGLSCTLSARDVWTQVVGQCGYTPEVLVMLERNAYSGFLKHATTLESDPYVYLSKPSVLPLNSAGLPDYEAFRHLEVDGILLKKTDVKSFWFIDRGISSNSLQKAPQRALPHLFKGIQQWLFSRATRSQSDHPP